MDLFLNPQRTLPYPSPLYQHEADPTAYYADGDLSIEVNVVGAGSCPEAPPTHLPMRKHDVFTKEHTLFILDLMRLHQEREGEGLPKSMKDLNSRLKLGRRNKKDLWADMAAKLTEQLKETFCPDKVSRKWCTLVQGYKKVKDNNASTGKGPMHFQFFPEMDDLLGAQHDVVFPVVGTTEGLDVRRQEAVVRSETATASTSVATTSRTTATTSHTSTPSSPTTSTSSNSTPPKGKAEKGEVTLLLMTS
ncbi:hypothetical protein PFLUV_G00052580 [Perca fluviatilis]|uniref:Myb/SANT-like DNA-binding domain-containing protein n=1 Tax=Perca fluviatilis TaxID=8168 RepID=A0A6A5F8I1_PERFL|nr:hypothetical protein PFLUV_G00052580 [Perca fluviatilis]